MIGGGDEDEGLKLKSSQARQKQPCDPTRISPGGPKLLGWLLACQCRRPELHHRLRLTTCSIHRACTDLSCTCHVQIWKHCEFVKQCRRSIHAVLLLAHVSGIQVWWTEYFCTAGHDTLRLGNALACNQVTLCLESRAGHQPGHYCSVAGSSAL